MKRRTFLKSFAAAGALTLMSERPRVEWALDGGTLKDGFLNPPLASHAKAWWHWMNGNVSAEGITLDLGFMKKMGLGGFHLFQVGAGIPQGPVKYGSAEHFQLLEKSAAEADRLGLEFAMMNCPGWSNTGGPWITPEHSMKQLTWSETTIHGGQAESVVLPQPYTKLGYYRDAFVLAFPSLPGETKPLRELLRGVTSSSGPVDLSLLTGSDLSKGVEVQPARAGEPAYLRLEFAELYEARSIAVYLFRIIAPGAPFAAGPATVALEASDDGTQFRKVCDLNATFNFMSLVFGGQSLEVPVSKTFPVVRARYYRLAISVPTRISALRLSGATYITDWPQKGNFVHRLERESGVPQPLPDTGAVPPKSAIDPAAVVDLTQHMDSKGRLHWQAPAGDWTILRFGQTTTGMVNHPAPEGGLGLECDKYSKAAYDFHFQHFFGKLLPAIRPLAAKGKAGAVIDSYEVGMQTWTAEFPQGFQARRGYDLRKYLPAMTGRVVGSGDVSDRFLWDFRRTCADLMADNYYGQFTEQCHQHGMKAYAEPYSDGPFEEIQAASRLDIPMGEFWAAQDDLDIAYSVKMASSAGHIFGKPVVAAESFTSDAQLGKWQGYPYALKAEADFMYTQGLNEIFLVEDYMQPHPTAKPGMNCSWGSMFSRTTTWLGHGGDWLGYLARCQYLLQQGLLVADVVYFTGVEVPMRTPARPDQLSPRPPAGLYYDVTNAEGILNRMQAGNGRMVLPDGASYRILVLPDERRITLELLRKIRDLVKQGAALVGPKPENPPGLTGFPGSDAELRRLSNELWGDLNGTTLTERPFGSGRVFWGLSMPAVAGKLGIQPDFESTSRSGDAPINFIHRRVGDAEIYFIANRRRQPEDLVCTFRVAGKQPEFWNPESGEIAPAPVFEFMGGRTRLPVQLGPAGSLFVVFRSPAKTSGLHAIARNNAKIVGIKPYPEPGSGRYRDVTNNFTLSVWVMPDVDDLGLPAADEPRAQTSQFANSSNYVIYPAAGEADYGRGHAACGLSVGRNGIIVLERSEGLAKPVLAARTPIAGWTHLALVYRGGAPSLYVNGDLLDQAKPSGKIIHPGLGASMQEYGATYFHGDMSEPKLIRETLSQSRIRKLAEGGVPEPESPPTLELVSNPGHSRASGNPALLIWRNGRYTLHDHAGAAHSFQVSGIEPPVEIGGPWRVSFPPDLGAPPEVTLPRLISLHKHSEAGVRYFSGTATYSHTFHFAPGGDSTSSAVREGGRALYEQGAAKRYFLDLGRIYVIAEVHVNGRNLGSLWKPPFRLDITDALRDGNNHLEVLVTNLWPNRMIGDEHLPPENEYTTASGFFSGGIKKLPDWYIEGRPKPPGGRITFSTWKHFDKNSALLESGLVGPVRLWTAVQAALGGP